MKKIKYFLALFLVASTASAGGPFLWGPTGAINLQSGIVLPGSTSGTFSLFPSASTTSYSLILPAAQGGVSTFLQNDGSGNLSWISTPSGSVTSVALTVPAFLSVSGSPITSSGTLAVTLSGTALPIANGGTGQTAAAAAFNALAPLTTTGDMVYDSSAATAARLPIGSSTNLLTVSGGVPAWEAIPTWNQNTSGTASNVTGTVAIANGGTGQTTANAGFNALSPMTTGGDLIYGGASGAATRLANGSAGQVLTSAGTTLAPTWTTGTAPSGSAGGDLGGSYPNPTVTSVADVSSGTLGVAHGGTGTATGSITGTGALTFTAGGSAQNVTLAPSTTGTVALSGPTTITDTAAVGAALTVTANSDMTGTALTLTSSSISSGSMLQVSSSGQTSGASINVTDNSTAAATGAVGVKVAVSGANANSNITRTGFQANVTATGTSNTNTAAFLLASGGTKNYGLIVSQGLVGIGNVAPTDALDVSGLVAATNFSDTSLSNGLPIFSGNPFTTGTLSGNTTVLGTTSGSLVSGDCVKIDANGNLVDAGSACGAGAGSVTSVAMTVPAFLSVSGSPITTSGTLGVTLSGTALPIANGGTAGTSASAAFNNLSPMTTLGDTLYGGASGAGTRLAGNTTTALNVLTQTGTGSASAAPIWMSGINAIGISTDYAAYTPTFTGVGTAASIMIGSRRVGDQLQISGSFTTGTVAASLASISLPAGLTIDTTKLSGSSVNQLVGIGANNQGGLGTENISVIAAPVSSTTALYFGALALPNTNSMTTQNGSAIFNTGQVENFYASVPIVGWSSSTIGTGQGTVGATYYMSTNNQPGVNTQFNFDSKLIDTNSAVTTGAGWKFTAPVTGSYTVALIAQANTAVSGHVFLYKNGSTYISLADYNNATNFFSGSVTLPLSAGDYIDARPTTNVGLDGDALSSGSVQSVLSIALNSGNGSGNVSSFGSGSFHHEFFGMGTSACSSSPCTLTSQSSGISQVTRSGTGTYLIVPVAGACSTELVCVVSERTGVLTNCSSGTGTQNTTGSPVACDTVSTGLAADASFNGSCDCTR